MAVDKVSRDNRQTGVQRSSRAQQRLAERAARREARRAEREEQGTSNQAGSTTSSTVQQPPAQASQPAPAAAEAASSERKNFIGSLKGARVVNFAVQGGRKGDSISVFASGEGPKSIRTEGARKTDAGKAESPPESGGDASGQKLNTVV